MKKTQFVMNPMAVLLGLVLGGIMIINSNPAFADPPGGRLAAVTQTCSNGVREGTEECDDGNVVANDGCSAVCEIEIIAPSGPMKVERLEAGTVKTARIEAGHVEVGTMNVGDQNVGNSRVARMDVGSIEVVGTKPVHSFSLLGSFGSGFNDVGPYTVFGRARYAVQWGIVGFSVKVGAGTIGSYDGYRVPALSLDGSLLIGNERGGAELGAELMPSGPFHKGNEWENTVAIKLGGFIRAPEKESNAFLFLPWLKIVVYEPKDPFFPAYNPLIMLGFDIGWEHLWFPPKKP